MRGDSCTDGLALKCLLLGFCLLAIAPNKAAGQHQPSFHQPMYNLSSGKGWLSSLTGSCDLRRSKLYCVFTIVSLRPQLSRSKANKLLQGSLAQWRQKGGEAVRREYCRIFGARGGGKLPAGIKPVQPDTFKKLMGEMSSAGERICRSSTLKAFSLAMKGLISIQQQICAIKTSVVEQVFLYDQKLRAWTSRNSRKGACGVVELTWMRFTNGEWELVRSRRARQSGRCDAENRSDTFRFDRRYVLPMSFGCRYLVIR